MNETGVNTHKFLRGLRERSSQAFALLMPRGSDELKMPAGLLRSFTKQPDREFCVCRKLDATVISYSLDN
jgi:hypothetical protein